MAHRYRSTPARSLRFQKDGRWCHSCPRASLGQAVAGSHLRSRAYSFLSFLSCLSLSLWFLLRSIPTVNDTHSNLSRDPLVGDPTSVVICISRIALDLGSLMRVHSRHWPERWGPESRTRAGGPSGGLLARDRLARAGCGQEVSLLALGLHHGPRVCSP